MQNRILLRAMVWNLLHFIGLMKTVGDLSGFIPHEIELINRIETDLETFMFTLDCQIPTEQMAKILSIQPEKE